MDIQNTITWKLIDMKPYTSYNISVRVKTGAGLGETSIQSRSSRKRYVYYSGVKTHNVTSTSVTVIREPSKNPNGRYEVSYSPNGGSLIAVDVENITTWKLADMKPCISLLEQKPWLDLVK